MGFLPNDERRYQCEQVLPAQNARAVSDRPRR